MKNNAKKLPVASTGVTVDRMIKILQDLQNKGYGKLEVLYVEPNEYYSIGSNGTYVLGTSENGDWEDTDDVDATCVMFS